MDTDPNWTKIQIQCIWIHNTDIKTTDYLLMAPELMPPFELDFLAAPLMSGFLEDLELNS